MKPDLQGTHLLPRHDRQMPCWRQHHARTGQLHACKAATDMRSLWCTLGKAQGSRVDGGEWGGLGHEVLLQEMADVREGVAS